jgi:peptidoglycan/LPS O-acetylase OafA/YrhL
MSARPLQSLFQVLDAWRVICAATVVLSHAGQLGLIPSIGAALMPTSHHAVILFFVISGFSVAYSTDVQSLDTPKFIVARMSRIFSIAIPAIIVTLLVDQVSAQLFPNVEPIWQLRRWPLYLAVASSFSNELWFWSMPPFSNIPFWSLNYEVYYYLVFAALLIRPIAWRVAATITVLLLIGPKVWLLLPCWWVGVSLYGWVKKNVVDQALLNKKNHGAWKASLVFVALYLCFYYANLTQRLQWGSLDVQEQLHYSKFFLSDWLLAIVFGVSLALHATLTQTNTATNPGATAKTISYFAPLTFAIYALHYPLLKFAADAGLANSAGTANAANGSDIQGVLTMLVVILICTGVGILLAPTRATWRFGIQSIFAKFAAISRKSGL